MWYRVSTLNKQSGAENVLQGSLPAKDTLRDTIAPYRWAYDIDQLPSFQSLIGFFQNDAIAKLKLLLKQLEMGELSEWDVRPEFNGLEAFMQKVIGLYRANPKYQHYVYPVYTELAKVIQLRRQMQPDYNGYFYEPSEHTADRSWWLADLLQVGYGTILNLEKLGLHMPPQFKMMMMAGLDIKAKPELANAHGRQDMIEYIRTKFPFYNRFEIRGQNDAGWINTIDQMFDTPEELIEELKPSLLPSEQQDLSGSYNHRDWIVEFLTKPMFKSGIPKTDLSRYIDYTTKRPVKVPPPAAEEKPQSPIDNTPEPVEFDPFEDETPPHVEEENTKIRTQIEILESQIGSFEAKDAGKLMMLFLDVADTAPLKTQERVVGRIMDKISTWSPSDCISREQIKKMMQHPVVKANIEKTIQYYYEKGANEYTSSMERLIKMGLAPDDVTIKYIQENPRAISTIMLDSEANKALWEKVERAAKRGARIKEIEEKRKERDRKKVQEEEERAKAKKEKETPRKTFSLLGQNIEQNNITHGTLATVDGGIWLQKARDIGKSMRLDPEVVDQWCNTVQVYIMENSNFERELRATKNPRYDTLSDFGEMYGLFTPSFSKDEISDQRLPSIWLKRYKIASDHEQIPLFRVLNIGPSISIEAVMGHEIAHALNFIATGGKMLRSDLDDMSGDKGRDYLTSYPELMARIYGEIPYWREQIHDKIDSMRTSTLIQQAVMAEISEQTLTHSAGAALGATDPIQEYARANQNLFPYYHTDNPVAAATKKVQRMEAKIAGMIKEDALKNRRQVLLNIIKQINELKAQLVVVEQASSELHEVDPSRGEQDRIKKEIAKLEFTKQQAMSGAFDLEIDTSINAVVDSFLIRYLKSISEAVNDPDWIPPQTWLTNDGEEIVPAFKPGSEPMSYYELKNLSEFSQNMANNAQGGAMDQPRNFETVLPTTVPGYQQTFHNQVLPGYPQLDENNNIIPKPKTAANAQ